MVMLMCFPFILILISLLLIAFPSIRHFPRDDGYSLISCLIHRSHDLQTHSGLGFHVHDLHPPVIDFFSSFTIDVQKLILQCLW